MCLCVRVCVLCVAACSANGCLVQGAAPSPQCLWGAARAGARPEVHSVGRGAAGRGGLEPAVALFHHPAAGCTRALRVDMHGPARPLGAALHYSARSYACKMTVLAECEVTV